MTKKKSYYPPKTFDDDLEALVLLFEQKGWIFSGVDVAQLKEDAKAQREERVVHDTLEGQYQAEHERFGQAQDARYQRFSAALNAARGAFRTDKVVMAEIDRFKRSSRRAKSSSNAA